MPTLKSRSKKEIRLTVLGYREDQEQGWVALALEMDLRGYGRTFDDALEELNRIVTLQISFALFKGEPHLIWKTAEPIYWRLFGDARRDRLQEFVLSAVPRNPQYAVGDLLLPPPHVIASLPDFQLADA